MSIEEKYDEVRQLISIGKEKGYLLYDEVNELLPSDITSSDELDDLFSTFGNAGIEVVDSEQKYREDKLLDRTSEGAEEVELDLTPGALDKTNDPVRMYLREMGTVPLLTREGEVEIAKRIERGKLAVIKSISRTPTVAKAIMLLGDQLKSGERTIRELVTFQDEELTDDRVEDRAREVLRQTDAVRKAWSESQKREQKLATIAQAATSSRYRRSRWKAMRAPRRAVDAHPRDRVHRDGQAPADRPHQGGRRGVRRAQREIEAIDRQLDRRSAAGRSRRRSARPCQRAAKEVRASIRAMTQSSSRDARRARRHARDDLRGEAAGRAGQEGARRGQPPPRRLDREEVHEPRPAVPRPDPGRQHRPDEGGRQVRVPPRLQVLDLRDVVDPPGHHPRDRRPGAHHPHPGAHDRDDQQADPHLARARAGARPRADLRGDRQADGHPGGQGPQGPEDRPGAHLARDADRRGGGFSIWATSSRIARSSPPPTR